MESTNDAGHEDDRTRPQDEVASKHTPAESTPAVGNKLSRWIATEPKEIQLPPGLRLAGERQTNGSLMPLRVCGYVFRVADVENWMEAQQLLPELKDDLVHRADTGWNYIMECVSSHGITCWHVRSYLLDKHGNETTIKCTAKSLILGTNETKRERLKARNMKNIELIHKVLGLPMGTLGPPQWLATAERR